MSLTSELTPLTLSVGWPVDGKAGASLVMMPVSISRSGPCPSAGGCWAAGGLK
jgi:hypothetical protein